MKELFTGRLKLKVYFRNSCLTPFPARAKQKWWEWCHRVTWFQVYSAKHRVVSHHTQSAWRCDERHVPSFLLWKQRNGVDCRLCVFWLTLLGRSQIQLSSVIMTRLLLFLHLLLTAFLCNLISFECCSIHLVRLSAGRNLLECQVKTRQSCVCVRPVGGNSAAGPTENAENRKEPIELLSTDAAAHREHLQRRSLLSGTTTVKPGQGLRASPPEPAALYSHVF